MAEDKNKMQEEQLQEDQLDEVNGGKLLNNPENEDSKSENSPLFRLHNQ